MNAEAGYYAATFSAFKNECDKPLEDENEIEEYCKKHNIPFPYEVVPMPSA